VRVRARSINLADRPESLDTGGKHLVAGPSRPAVGEDLDLLRPTGARRQITGGLPWSLGRPRSQPMPEPSGSYQAGGHRGLACLPMTLRQRRGLPALDQP